MFSVCFSGLLRTEDESLITVLFSYEGVLVQLCVESPSSRFDMNQDGFSRKAASCVLSLVCKESYLRWHGSCLDRQGSPSVNVAGTGLGIS